MKTFSVLLVFIAICQIVDKTRSQQCPAFGSEESILGWMLQGHVYQTMMANIGLHCLSVCLKDDRCQSFNFVMSLHMCEFSDRTKEARPEDFIPDADRYYFRKYINRAPLGSISELAAETCKEIKMSEGRAPNGKYWMSSIKPGIPVLAFCDMKTEDVDECTASSPVCHVNATCNNTLGSYRCTCNPGYAGDGKICRDFDECSASLPVCDVNALCNNSFGSYHCACKLGYAGDGKTCQDINECNASPSPCHVKAKCKNNQGSYLCSCEAGYTGNGKTCTDINECNASPSPCHVKAKCKNNQGSYLCSCEAGYTGNGKTCTDINECSTSFPVCHTHASCYNTLGSYHCTCKPGYIGNGKYCAAPTVTVSHSCLTGLLIVDPNKPSGVIRSNKKIAYTDKMDCYWRFTSNANLQLTFSRFKTESCCDYVSVYNGGSTSSRLLGKFSGNSVPQPITSTSTQLYVRFTTDGSVIKSGFVARYEAIADGSIRLRGHYSLRKGRVEIFYNDQWGTVCDDGWDINDARVICRQLGFPRASAAYHGSYYGRGTGPIWLDDVACSGSETHVYKCGHRGWGTHDCTHSGDASADCSYASSIIRLADGGPFCGRVEVYYNGQWGTVCDDGWDINDAHVACRQLGFRGASYQYQAAKYGEGTGKIWLDDVECNGGEASLYFCKHSGWGTHNCVHGEDTSIMCYL